MNISLLVSWSFVILLLRILCLNLYPVFNWIIWFVGIYFLVFFIYFGNLLDLGLMRIFSYSIGWCFVLLIVSFALQTLFNFHEVHLLIVNLKVCAIGVLFRKLSPVPMHAKLFSTFSSIKFCLSIFMCRSLIQLDLSFQYILIR